MGQRRKAYGEDRLKPFPSKNYQFRSPDVPMGFLTERPREIDPDLEIAILPTQTSSRRSLVDRRGVVRMNNEPTSPVCCEVGSYIGESCRAAAAEDRPPETGEEHGS